MAKELYSQARQQHQETGVAKDPTAMRLLAMIPSNVCFGLQDITLAFFGRFSKALQPHFIITRDSDGEFEKRLAQLGIAYSFSRWSLAIPGWKVKYIKNIFLLLGQLPGLYRDFLLALRRVKPAMLFFANHQELLLLWPVLLLLRLGGRRIPVLCHFHDARPASFWQKLLFRLYAFPVDHFVCVSHSVRRGLLLLGGRDKQAHVVHNGVEMPSLLLPRQRSPRFAGQYAFPADCFIIGMTGQLTPTKGHLDLLGAAALLVKKYPALRFVIGGKSSDMQYNSTYYQELQKFITNNQLQNHVFFTGWQPSSQAFFEAIDVFALLSRHNEGYGLVVAEAMACGLPVLASKSGGVVEIVVDGKTGYLVDKKSPQQIAEKIEALYLHPQQCAAMGLAGRHHIETYFDVDKQSQVFEQVLRTLAGQAQA